MKAIDTDAQRPWYEHWHGILDEVIGPDSQFDLESAIVDPYGDFRMHFVTWDLPDSDLHRCFEIFSCGKSMADRAIEFRRLYRENATQMSEGEAVRYMQSGLDAYARFSDSSEQKAKIQLFRGTADQVQTEIGYTDSLYELVAGHIISQHPMTAEISNFLSETLYRLTNSYHVANYILWPLFVDARSIDPHRHFAMIDISDRYCARIGDDGPVLFIQTE